MFKKSAFLAAFVILSACLWTCVPEVDDGYIRVVTPEFDPNENVQDGQLKVVGNKVFRAVVNETNPDQSYWEEFRLLGVNVWDYDILGVNTRARLARCMEWLYNEWHGTIIRLPLEVDATEIYADSQKRPLGDYAQYLDAMKDLVSVAKLNK